MPRATTITDGRQAHDQVPAVPLATLESTLTPRSRPLHAAARQILMSTVPSTAPFQPSPLSDADYQRIAQAVLSSIESTLDRWLQEDRIDIDSQRTGGLLEMSFPNGSKLIVNTQPPLHELWLAAKGGGFHYKWDGQCWRDTRDGSEFLAALSRHASQQGGQALQF